MSEALLNGRPPEGWEVPAIRRAAQHARDRDLEVLAGVLAGDGEPYPPRAPVPPPSRLVNLYEEAL